MLRRPGEREEPAVETPSRVATLAAALGLAAAVAFVLGPAAIQIGAVSPFVGFRIFGLGLLLGVLALVCGTAGLWRTRAAAGRHGRRRAVVGMGLGLTIVAIVALAAGSAGNVPVINDITTDPEDPPVFTAAQQIEANRGRDLGYPGDDVARQQREGYPDLAPIRVSDPPAAAFARAERAAAALKWEITYRDPTTGVFEAVEVTRIFRFVDDIVVRVRISPGGNGSIVDVRSKSRDGRGDMGANAARIRAFRDALSR
jgi:uncharacterized protein (DUF1499 family)